MIEASNVLWYDIAKVDQRVDLGDVVRLAVVIPSDYLDNVGLDVVDGLLPSVVPKGVSKLDPVAETRVVLKLPGRNG